jgi:predicted aspartyl protease
MTSTEWFGHRILTMKVPISLLGLLLAAHLSGAPAERPPEIPFELVQNEIVVSAKLNGKGPYLMTIDTGADSSTVDISTALKMGLTVNPAGEEVEGGETEEGTVYDTRFAVVELGGISARDVDALAGGMVAKLAKRLGRPIAGALGHSFLAGRIVQFDYPKRVLRFLPDPPAGKPVPGRRAVMSFKDDEGVLVDEISINGQRMRGAIDTGSSSPLELTPDAARKLGIQPGKVPGVVRSLSVGAISADSVAATFWKPGSGHGKKPWEAVLGNGFLKDFVLTIDYPDLKVVIEKP